LTQATPIEVGLGLRGDQTGLLEFLKVLREAGLEVGEDDSSRLLVFANGVPAVVARPG